MPTLHHPFYQKEDGERVERGDVLIALKSASGTHPHCLGGNWEVESSAEIKAAVLP